ncbi:HAMP domain-containing histidine kinase [Cohnella nanjingensis]|uniref:histidine kinase n=2 Tax=Cohnella nanjingensis TaxID=1387779 RepID=A0A7X0VHP4_9BACL|nr:HAMP domain-containing histidine kinase [Cohnella nanjingensis]
MKREIRRIASQLRQYNNFETEKKIDLSFIEKDIEALAVEINRQSDLIVQANAEKRRTEDELRQAVANISHDLRTPLTSVFGYIQLLESGGLTPQEQRESIAVIKNRIKRLQALLNDFFELSVIESVDYRMRLERLDMSRLLPEILIGYYDRFNERQLSPNIQIVEEETIIIADERAVRRVVENLILNSIRHAKGDTVIRLEKRGIATILTICNEARHLAGINLDLLFNRFYMADQTRAGIGSGLGLSIARSLMLRMNGKLTAELIDDHLHMKCEWKSG